MSAEQALPPGMDMSSPEAQAAAAAALEQLWAVLSDLRLTKYFYVSAMVVLFWDICLTFDLEVQRVWKTQASVGKYLFIFNRYVPLVLFIFDLIYQLYPNPTLEFCRNSFLPSSILGIVAIGSVEFVLVLRTYALYNKKWMLYILVFLCVGSCVTMTASVVYLTKTFIEFAPSSSLPGLPGCVSDCRDPKCRVLLTVFWVPFFCLQALIVALTIWKSWTTYTVIGAKKSPFVSIVYRDGLLYYAIIMSVSIANLMVWLTAPPTLSYLATSMNRSLQVTIASRLLLNIRGMLDKGYGTTSYFNSTQMEVSTIGFRGNAKPIPNRSISTGPLSDVDTRTSSDLPLSTLKNRSSTWDDERW